MKEKAENIKIKMPDNLRGDSKIITRHLQDLCFYTPCKIGCEECAFNSMENFNKFINEVGL